MVDIDPSAPDTRDSLTIAQEHLNRGIALTQADQRILDSALGNGDGAFDDKDRLKIKDDQTAFDRSVIDVGVKMAEYSFASAGAQAISNMGLSAIFGGAATGPDNNIHVPSLANRSTFKFDI